MKKVKRGLWLLSDNYEIRGYIEDYSHDSISMNLDKSCLSKGVPTLSFISCDKNHINYIAIATKGQNTGSFEAKVIFDSLYEFDEPVALKSIIEGVPNRYKRFMKLPEKSISNIAEGTLNELLQYLIASKVVNADEIERFKLIISSRKSFDRSLLNESLDSERDAALVALDIFGGSKIRRSSLEKTHIDNSAPFIKSLEKSGVGIVLEDHMINNDQMQFPGAKEMKQYLVGAIEINTNDGRLTIVNSNRASIENTLGVDLIYYNLTYKSFVLVQYKRLIPKKSDDSDEFIYRPNADKSYSKEIERMRSYEELIFENKKSDIKDYRLNCNPFFFKFCKSKVSCEWNQMIPGIYMPLELWDIFLKSSSSNGPNGGKYISYDNAKRWLTNTDFTKLVKSGWIGSQGGSTSFISNIIERGLHGDRSIIYAIEEHKTKQQEYLRDRQGRFAPKDDPDAV